MTEIHPYQTFYGALARGPKHIIDKYIKDQLKNANVLERRSVGNQELIKFDCLGCQVDCQSEEYKELAIAIFTTLGCQAFLFFKKAGETELKTYEIGEVDTDTDDLQIYTECPDKTIHEKFILCNCGEGVEFKYAPSEYVISMVSQETINEKATIVPNFSCEYLNDYDEELEMYGHIVIV